LKIDGVWDYTLLMGKGVIIALVVGALILAGVGGYFAMNRSGDTSDDLNSATGESTKQSRTLRELLGLGSNQQCSFKDTETISEGVMYIAGERVRGDFTTEFEEKRIGSHMISDGENVYIWVDNEAQGFKMPLSSLDDLSDENGVFDRDTYDIDKEVDYECRGWVVDETKFSLPSGVNFQDISAIMNNPLGTGPSLDSLDCSMCDSVPAGEARDQCLSVLGC
jgi:hypothetical protein